MSIRFFLAPILICALIWGESFGHSDDEQKQYEEAQRRLEERTRQRQEASPGTQPTTRPAAVQRVVKTKKLVLRDGAPEAVKQWYANIDSHHANMLVALQRVIDAKEEQVKEIQRRPLPQVVVSRRTIGPDEYGNDPKAAAERAKQVREMRKEVGQLKRLLKQCENDKTTVLAWFPPLGFGDLRVGAFGQLRDYMAMKVFQIAGPSDLIVKVWHTSYQREYDGEMLWLTGIDTSNMVDEKIVSLNSPLMITGTKTYATAIGGQKTILLAEPVEVLKWVEIVEVER